MDSQQKERIKNFEERQKLKEKRDKFGRIVFGHPEDGFYDLVGILGLLLFLIRLVGGLIVWLIVILIKKAFKRTK